MDITLEAILKSLEQLSPDQRAQVRHRLDDLDVPRSYAAALNKPSQEEVRAWMADLDAAIDCFREGISDEAMDAIAEAMNVEDVEDIEDLELTRWVAPPEEVG